DFANQNHCARAFVLGEELDAVKMRQSADRITPDSDAGRLPVTARSKLPNRFVGQCPAARNYANAPWFMNVTWHDADLARVGGDDSRTVRSDQSRPSAAHECSHPHHVHHGNSFGDANHKIDICIDGFEN